MANLLIYKCAQNTVRPTSVFKLLPRLAARFVPFGGKAASIIRHDPQGLLLGEV